METNRTGSGRTGFDRETVRRYWRPIIAIVVASTLVGGLLGFLRTPVHTAEVRLAVGSGEMSNLNIPGFPTASAQLAANYARWVTSQGIGGMGLPEGTSSVLASPLPESNVLRVEATSTDPEVAKTAAWTVAQRLQDEVNKVATTNDPGVILEQVLQTVEEVTVRQVARDRADRAYRDALERGDRGAELDTLRERAVETAEEYTESYTRQAALQDRYRRMVSQASTEATLEVLAQEATLTKNDQISSVQRFALIGFVGGALVGLLFMAWAERRRVTQSARRVRSSSGDASQASP